MSNMSELSIAAATTRNEGPDSIDLLAHELAHHALAYINGTLSYSDLTEASLKFRDAWFVIDQASTRHVRLEQVPDLLANEFALLESLMEGRDYSKCREKLREWQRSRDGLRALGLSVYKVSEP